MLAASIMICKWKIYSLSGRYHLLELIMTKKTCLLVNYPDPDPGRKKKSDLPTHEKSSMFPETRHFFGGLISKYAEDI